MRKIIDNRKIIELIQKLPDWFVYLGVSILLFEEFLNTTFQFSFLRKDNIDLRVSLGIAVIAIFIIVISLKFNEMNKKFMRLTNKYLGVLEVLLPHEQIDFKAMLENNTKIKILTLSGTKAVSLGDGKVQELLQDKKRKSEIILLLANPFSDAIIRRYANDEPETFEAGTAGIKRRLIWLQKLLNELPKNSRKKIDIKIYDNYPVVSILQADNDIYSTSYGFKLRGGDCPKLHSEINGEYGKFLMKHFNKVYKNATPLDDWYVKYKTNLEEAEVR